MKGVRVYHLLYDCSAEDHQLLRQMEKAWRMSIVKQEELRPKPVEFLKNTARSDRVKLYSVDNLELDHGHVLSRIEAHRPQALLLEDEEMQVLAKNTLVKRICKGWF